MLTLCSQCNRANGSQFEEGECHVCGGRMPDPQELAEMARALLEKEGVSSFSISTIIPKDWLIQEEDLWDLRISGARSIKDFMNRELSSLLTESTGLEYLPEADCRVSFDLRSGNVSLEREGLNIFGRYEKLVPGISQSRWVCKSCGGKGCGKCGGRGKRYHSIEEIIGEAVKKECAAAGYSLHASGREDVDALNSAGRPFVLSVRGPGNRKPDLKALEDAIANGGQVRVRGLRLVPRRLIELVTESHFDKEYEAVAGFGKEISEGDIRKILSLSGAALKQRTPTRVAHRRADLVRTRRVLAIECTGHSGSRATFRIRAEAGTYIKELISGDGGRTEPSMASIMGTEAKCEALTVTAIDDRFLDLCLEPPEKG